ncbi:uncharacterized protein TrAtP1_002049 [Trichoderma atroviride]|uniref:uncharacterized protein n=1 Tax=Hypocrea atroviridis TaxID=63577 RepID=UPI00331709F0|nr:hypothetical protein TrAtP1_002049 [Trichoderma atroviride]
MPVTTILQHAIERDTPVTAEAGSDTRMSNDVGNVFPDHVPVVSKLDSTEGRSPKTPRGSKRKKTATAISSSSSPQTKQPRKASAPRRQRESCLSSTQIASETNYCTLATEEPLSSETLSLGASFFVPLGLSNGMFNGMFNSMATYEQSPKGTWEPQLTCYHTTPASSTNWAVENPFPNAYMAAEEAFNLFNGQSTTASPSTSQSNSEQRSSFASSAGQISPASYFTAHSSPMGYKTFQPASEDSASAMAVISEPADEYSPPAYNLQHFNQQAVTCSREEEGALHHVATCTGKSDIKTAHPVPVSSDFAFFISSSLVVDEFFRIPQRRHGYDYQIPVENRGCPPEGEARMAQTNSISVVGELPGRRGLFALTSSYNQSTNSRCVGASGCFIFRRYFV